MVLLIVSFILCMSLTVKISESKRYTQQSGEWTSLVPRKTAAVNHRRMLEAQTLNPHENPFVHIKHLVSAVTAKKSSFRVYEEVDTVGEKDPSSYKDILSAELYNLTASYNMFQHQRYHSLDTESQDKIILDIQRDYIDICADISTGDFLIASDAAYWFNTNPTWSDNLVSKVGLVLSRTVVGVSPLELPGSDGDSRVTCKRAKTENITPFQLFEFIRVDSTSRLPAAHFYNSKDANDRLSNLHKKRRLYNGAGQPDAPVVACTDSSVIAVDEEAYVQEHQGNDDDYMVISGYTDGCVSILKNFLSEIGSSFNFNYDPSTNSAANSFDLVGGITCSNCYAYLGVYIYGVFEYASLGAQMAFEAKLDGGIGFNIQLDLSSATYSGSDTIPLMAASSSSVPIPLGFGLVLSASFGGLTATVSASATTSGSASMGAGANANAYIGLEYDYEFNSAEQGYFSFPNNAELSYTAPYFSYSNLEISSMDVTLTLAATENFYVGYEWLGIDWLGADFALVFSGSAEVSYSSSSSAAISSSMTVTTGTAVQSESDATNFGQFLPLEQQLAVIRPGDVIPVTVGVAGFHPGETVVLFFSFLREDHASEVGVPLFKTEFVVPSNGSAAVTTHWRVPWDHRFLQNPSSDSLKACRIAVRGSNKMSNTYYSSEFLVLADAVTDSLVSAPTNGDTIVAGKPTLIEWNHENLQFFKYRPGTGGHGKLITVQKVDILLVKESFDASSTSTSPRTPVVTTFNLTKNGVLQNNGSAMLTIPEEAAQWINGTASQRFFIKVQAHRWGNLVGWSRGHFNVVHKSHYTAASNPSPLVAAQQPRSERFPADDFSNFRYGRHREYVTKNEPVKRATSSCTISVTISAAIDGSLTDVVVCEIPFSVGLSTGEITVYNSGAVCVDDTSFNPVPAPAPAPAPGPSPSPPSAYFSYFASLEQSTDDNVPNTITNAAGSSPTAAPAPVGNEPQLSGTNADGSNVVLLVSIIASGAVVLMAIIVAIICWSRMRGGVHKSQEEEDISTCTNASAATNDGGVLATSLESSADAKKSQDALMAADCLEIGAVNNPMQN